MRMRPRAGCLRPSTRMPGKAVGPGAAAGRVRPRQTIPCSRYGRPSRVRRYEKQERSIVWWPPFTRSSAMRRPAAGACMMPCPQEAVREHEVLEAALPAPGDRGVLERVVCIVPAPAPPAPRWSRTRSIAGMRLASAGQTMSSKYVGTRAHSSDRAMTSLPLTCHTATRRMFGRTPRRRSRRGPTGTCRCRPRRSTPVNRHRVIRSTGEIEPIWSARRSSVRQRALKSHRVVSW